MWALHETHVSTNAKVYIPVTIDVIRAINSFYLQVPNGATAAWQIHVGHSKRRFSLATRFPRREHFQSIEFFAD